jgi:hypothetical protein
MWKTGYKHLDEDGEVVKNTQIEITDEERTSLVDYLMSLK